MPTNLLLTALLAVTCGVIQAREPAPAEAGPGITAKVRGTLRHEKGGHIYSVVVPPDVKGGQEIRVWLMRGEDKDRELDRKLEGLEGKEVVVEGRLAQMPKDASHATIPPMGLYLDGRWSVEAAKAKS